VLAKLVKFVVLTRFSKPLLGIVSFFLAYDIVIRVVTTGNASNFSGGFSYYAVGASIFFIAASLLLGGLFVLKSDRDYLLTLPLRRRDLSFALFVAQFIGSGITILFLFGFYLAGAGTVETTIVLVFDLVLLASVVTAFGVISNILAAWKRVLLAVAIGLWCSLSIFGVPFTPVSAFTGEFLFGSIVLLGVAVIVVPVALRELAYIELGSIRSMLRATSSEYKKNLSFAGKSPLRAIYSYHLSFVELVGRVNMAGSTSYRAARVKTSTVLAISTVAAAVFLYFAGISPITDGARAVRGLVFVVPIFMGVFTLVLMSQGTLSNERGWLAFTAMDPAKYLRHLVLSKIASAMAIIGPFAVALATLALLGDSIALNSSIVLLVTIPSASILATYLVARMGAVQQVKEEGMLPGQFELKQILAIIPVYIVIILIVISEISFVASLVIASTLGALSLIFMVRAGIWRGIAYRLTEKGFI
jgi:hypothetical protein